MSRKEFDEAKGIAMEMKSSDQTEILTPVSPYFEIRILMVNFGELFK